MTQTPSNVEPQPLENERYDGALRFLYERLNYERLITGSSRYRFRLRRITQLLRQLDLGDYLHADTPQPKVPLVHIAGTKGKGSVAAMVAAVLSAAGHRTGLYTSPHLHCLEERFRVDGDPCSRAELVSLVDRIRPATTLIQRSLGSPSFFELTTALALLHFHTRACEAIVLEVGLGGRLDSTNVCSPSVSSVVSIGLDHEHVLGRDLGTIAGEKAGIFKKDVPVVSGVAGGEAAEVIARKADSQGSRLYQLGRDFSFEFEAMPDWGSVVTFSGCTPPLSPGVHAALSMEGEHQARNAAVAIAIIDLLRSQGNNVPLEAIGSGLGRLQCNSRIERFDLPRDVTAIIDAAHNQDSITALCDCLRHRFKNRQIAVVFGTSIDKSAAPMLQSLADLADQLVLTQFVGNPRFRPPQDLLPIVPAKLAQRTTLVEDPIEACRQGLDLISPGGTLVVCGSFFLAAETRHWVAARAEGK